MIVVMSMNILAMLMAMGRVVVNIPTHIEVSIAVERGLPMCPVEDFALCAISIFQIDHQVMRYALAAIEGVLWIPLLLL
jgi:hypothetical protein